jgi:gas vesicle protein
MNNASKILLAVGTGIVVGTALGILYAPEEGYETRKKIMKKSKKLVGVVNDSIDEDRESLEEIKEVLQKQISKVNRKIEEFKVN